MGIGSLAGTRATARRGTVASGQVMDNELRPVNKGSEHDKSHVRKDESRLDMGPKKSKQKDF